MWESDGEGGTKVYDAKPEAIGHVGTIVGSYDDQFPNPSREQNGPISYEIEWPEGTKLHVAWWHEYQLEPADINTPREQQEHYPDYKESNIAKELEKMVKKIETDIMWRDQNNK